jgi:chromosome segregation ATPase
MSDHPVTTQAMLVELYALDLDADTGEQIRLLKRLREDLALNLTTGQGAISVARERFELATRATEALLAHMRVHRELLNELRASIKELRSSLHATNALTEERPTAQKPLKPGD